MDAIVIDPSKEGAREVMQHYFVAPNPATFFHDLDSVLAKLPSPFVSCGGAFRHNLESVILAVGVPFQIALASVQVNRFQFFHLGEKIRSGRWPDEETPSIAALDAERAAGRWKEDLATEEGQSQVADAACSFLRVLLPKRSVRAAAEELLRQAAVLTWSAIEVLVRDTFIACINTQPALVRSLFNDSNTKDLFPFRGISFLDALEKHGFDLSGVMGDILAAKNDLNHLATIKDVLNVLFPDATRLRSVLGARRLWVLFQRRNLIVHNRGVVDSKYLEKTGESHAVGDVLVISPDGIQEDLNLARDVGKELCGSIVAKFAVKD